MATLSHMPDYKRPDEDDFLNISNVLRGKGKWHHPDNNNHPIVIENKGPDSHHSADIGVRTKGNMFKHRLDDDTRERRSTELRQLKIMVTDRTYDDHNMPSSHGRQEGVTTPPVNTSTPSERTLEVATNETLIKEQLQAIEYFIKQMALSNSSAIFMGALIDYVI